MAPSYVPLWCKSNFSFLEGASHPGELVVQAHALGLPALALTDRDGVYGVVRAHVTAREAGLPLILGSEVTLADGSTLVLLAAGREGWRQLCRLLTVGRRRGAKGSSTVRWDEVCAHAPGLLALWGGARGFLATGDDESVARVGDELCDAFGDRLYALVARHHVADEVPAEARLRARAARLALPTVAAVEVLYHDAARKPLQDALTCVRHGVTVRTAGRRTTPNAEHALLAPAAMAARFADDPASVARTLEVAARCTFSLAAIRYVYPAERLPQGATPSEWLRTLTFAGARERYGGEPPADVLAQLERELTLIARLDYGGYFLTMAEIVRFCREQGILCQGRGSAANSAVCYCLGITAIDPVRMGLLFERFLSLERAEPPDIDLDIEHDRREEVIQHVYQKYDRDHAAMVANVIAYRARSAARDLGKALGLPLVTVDRIAKHAGHWDPLTPEVLERAGVDPRTRTARWLLDLHRELLGFPRHLSIHPGGFLLGHEPVHDLVPIENAAMEDRTVIQWDKDDVEALGLFKVDLLGLGALNMLHHCFDLLRRHRGETWSMATIPPDDPRTYAMICRADTIGVFQIESRAQMSMLPRLKPRYFYDLVIEVSIVRPGPITGGMVHPFLRRRRGEEPVVFPHPALEPVLAKTLGVPLFQEQVMRLAVVAADYTPGEADQLRRDMAAWRKHGKLEEHRERLIGRMLTKGIAQEFAERVFDQIRGFGEYGFPESHGASFALISYATAWLRCHYQAEFTCGLLNAWPMGFYAPATVINDARRHGVEVRPPDVTVSEWGCTLEPFDSHPIADAPGSLAQGEGARVAPPSRFAVRIGLRFVRGLAEADGTRIVCERGRRPFAGVADFADRTQLRKDTVQRLAEAGALGSLGLGRREAIWEGRGVARTDAPALRLAGGDDVPCFEQLTPDDELTWDYETQHLSVRGHQLDPFRDALRRLGLPDAAVVTALPNGAEVRYAGMVLNRQRPHTASGVTFMTLEDATGMVNLVVWPSVWERFAAVARTARLLGVTGRMQVQDGTHHLIVEEMWEPDLAAPVPEGPGSRDFR